MNFSSFFVERPIFAAVLSILIFTAGAIAIPLMPVTEFPQVVPPTVQVTASYPGANPKVIAETVATPLEEAITGVEHMMYMKSVAGSDGILSLTATFRPGTDIDQAQVQVQNRVSQALARLPEDVRRLGVTTQKRSPTLTMVVHLTSPEGQYDAVYLRNYAVLHIKDELARIPGVGDARIFGAGDYSMRIWLDPDQIASRDLTAGDIVRAIREQNIQVSAGRLGAPPQPVAMDLTLSINTRGRLISEQEFEDIVIKTGDGGVITRLSDVARIELGASEYALRALLDNQQAVAIPIFQSPGSNAIELSDNVRARMSELAQHFPEGVSWQVVYDPTVFVRDSIKSVIKTLIEAILMVIVVVILFLQTWRASIIPLLAVPVSIVGTFAVLLLLGFSINTLTLFGLVLAIGIVVDDAIVVVENVERNIANGLQPKAAAHQAMREVSGPIIAIALVLTAVFVPMAFLSGVTGQFYRQFAVAIAISTIISAINSLTLSPALAASLLRAHGAPPDGPTRFLNRLFGWLFRPFNRAFNRSSDAYSRNVSRNLRRSARILLLYGGMIALTWVAFQAVPGGFIPTQDKLYLIGGVKMPEGSSLDRTEAMVRKMSEMALSTEGVAHAVAFPGLNVLQFNNTPNTATVFLPLKPFSERRRPAQEILEELSGKLQSIQEGFAFVIMPPAVLGLGTGSGFSLYLQDRSGLGYGELQDTVQAFSGALSQQPGFTFPITSYQANVPQLEATVDRTKAKQLGLPLTEVFEALQVYLGSIYVNDFNRFGRTYQVIAQADARFRDEAEDITDLRARNQAGQMVPIGSVITVGQTYGPDPVIRYNGYPAADLVGSTDPRLVSSSEAIATIEALAPQVLPGGMAFEWTDLSYAQVTQGKASLVVFPLAVLLVFLVLAALYESWILPLAVILIVPLSLLAALTGVWLTGGDNNIFVQVGLVVLMGLACKNAILIVEFARDLELQGMSLVRAAVQASKLRLRPIVMTSVAFIAGVVPLILSSGAGAEVRHALGVTVFSGMVGVTLFGLVMTPVFYVVLRHARRSRKPKPSAPIALMAGEP
ncbi:MAG TPA: multidrug efflux RND transporter permease subunit [Xanthomonadales bacterium]|nr:multidrug efflux RND transporter permease subunit [Xanthomonadales bacterium]